MPVTIGRSIERALDALAALERIGEDVADEWQYVVDIASAWRERLGTVRAARGAEELTEAVAGAIEAAVREAESIADPHRAIDWLSTMPQLVLNALGEVD